MEITLSCNCTHQQACDECFQLKDITESEWQAIRNANTDLKIQS